VAAPANDESRDEEAGGLGLAAAAKEEVAHHDGKSLAGAGRVARVPAVLSSPDREIPSGRDVA
jgi:hypothetical protein